MRLKNWICAGALAASLWSVAFPVCGQSWTADVLTSRASDAGPVTVGIAVTAPPTAPVRHVIVYHQPGGTPVLKHTTGSATLRLGGPWGAAAPRLLEQGVAMLYADPPSDAAGRGAAGRSRSELQKDLQATVDDAHRRFPQAQVHLGTFASGSTALQILSDLRGVARIVVLSGTFAASRASSLTAPKVPVMLVHAPATDCEAAPWLEAQQVATALGAELVQAGSTGDANPGCGVGSQHALVGLGPQLADTVVRWLDGGSAPPFIGTQPSMRALLHERLLHYYAPGVFGRVQLEMTLLIPDRDGPVPVLVFNHGDIEPEHPSIRRKERFRDLTVAREFLRLGFAVAFPTRRGVGRSEGTYPASFSRDDGDPTYKARVHAEDIIPALEALRSLPEIDGERIVLSGQSAGGYSAMYLATLGFPGVVGVVNFSGGRTDSSRSGGGPSSLNRMMVSGFAEFGRATRVPVLLIFAEDDSRYSVETIRKSAEAFNAAGGKAQLLVAPKGAQDGHLVYHSPEAWREAVAVFLRGTGLVAE